MGYKRQITEENDDEDTEVMLCSVWMLMKTSGTPDETAAVNHAIALTVVASTQVSVARDVKTMELTTVDLRSGK